MPDTPNLGERHFRPIATDRLLPPERTAHAPRILLLYGSLRERSFSRLVTEEAARILARFGAGTRTYSPSGLPLPDDADVDHPKVHELRELVAWSEGMVWCSPERHGAMTGIMKARVDRIPLSLGGVRPTQSKTLAVTQVSGGSPGVGYGYAFHVTQRIEAAILCHFAENATHSCSSHIRIRHERDNTTGHEPGYVSRSRRRFLAVRPGMGAQARTCRR